MLYYYGIMRAGWGAGVGCILAVVFVSAIFKQLMQGATNGHHYVPGRRLLPSDKRASLPGRRFASVNLHWQVTRRTIDEILCGILQKAISPIHGCTPPLCAE